MAEHSWLVDSVRSSAVDWSKDLKLASQEELNTHIDNFLSTHSQHLKTEALIKLVYKE